INAIVGQKVTLPKEYEKDGYKLSGWEVVTVTDGVETKEVYGRGAEIRVAENTTVTAVWDEIIYSNTMTIPEYYQEEGANNFKAWVGGLKLEWVEDSYLADGSGALAYKYNYDNPGDASGQHRSEFTAVRGVTYYIGFWYKTVDFASMGGSFGGGGHSFTLKNAGGVNDGIWINFQIKWTAPATDTYYLWWKMHGFKKGDVYFDHLYCIAEDKYAEYSVTAWTTEMAALATAENASYTLEGGAAEATYLGAACEDAGVTISYLLPDETEYRMEAPTFAPGVHTFKVVFHKDGYIDYEKEVTVTVIDANASRYTATFTYDGSAIVDPVVDVENTVIQLPEAPDLSVMKEFRYWYVVIPATEEGAEDTIVEYSVGDEYILKGDVEFIAYYRERSTENLYANGAFAELGTWGGWNQNKYLSFESEASHTDDGTGSAAFTYYGDGTNITNGNGYLSFNLVSGVKYTLSAWFKNEGFVRGPSPAINARFKFNNTSPDNNTGKIASFDFSLQEDTDWYNWFYEFTATESGTYYLIIKLNSLKAGRLLVDDIELKEVIPADPYANQITNGAFKSLGTWTGWNSDKYISFDQTTTHTEDGTGSAKFTYYGDGTNTTNGNSVMAFELEAGVTYDISLWCKTEKLLTAPGFAGGVLFRNDTNADSSVGVIKNLLELKGIGTSDWTQVTCQYTPTASGTYYIMVKMNALSSGSLWLDDFSVCRARVAE
ncbi:MAG: hypothetical protein IIW27_03405, partial [Clostridia bacterium]|nr:hypothetical protein [Clostridia bacterium]